MTSGNGGYWAITAQIETHDGEYHGSRQVPTFYLHEGVQMFTGEDGAANVARDILSSAIGANSEFAAPVPVMHITAVRL